MAYNNFAYYYDRLNREADYGRLAARLLSLLAGHGVKHGILADLGCGTGELSLWLHEKGYDLLAVDASPEMLSVFRDKLAGRGIADVLLLNQNLAELDLYGTIRAAVSTFDTLNHIPPCELGEVFRRVSLFMEPGGLFLFDVNSPFKHREILANNSFEIGDDEGLACLWENRYNEENASTHMVLTITENGRLQAREEFTEYAHSRQALESLLEQNAFDCLQVLDGETFAEPCPESERYLFVAKKRH